MSALALIIILHPVHEPTVTTSNICQQPFVHKASRPYVISELSLSRLFSLNLSSTLPRFKFLNNGEAAPKKYFDNGIRAK